MGQDSDLGKRIESYTRVIQGQRELFSDFLQRLTKTVQIGVTDPEARHVLLKSLAFQNVNLECKKILGPLKFRSVSMDKRILQTMNDETFDYSTEALVEEAISNGMRRHQNTKCFNCGRIGHLIVDIELLGLIYSPGMARIGFSLQVYVGGVAKALIGPMNIC